MYYDLSNRIGSKHKRKSPFSNSFMFSLPTINERYKRIEKRPIDTSPFKILDAPGLIDDYYLNLLDWNRSTIVIALGDTVYGYNTDSKAVLELFQSDPATNCYISSVKGFNDKIAIGDSSGLISIYDMEQEKVVQKLQYHNSRVTSISFSDRVMSSGDKSGMIYNTDHRVNPSRTHNLGVFEAHTQAICGLKWSPNNDYLASGSNDNSIRIWKPGSPVSRQLVGHESAVRALDWCPWKPCILATGGGSKDKTIKFWDVNDPGSSSIISSISSHNLDSQICTINYLSKYKEIVTGHGFQVNDLKLWKSSNMTLISSFGSHDSRVLHTAVSPDECTIVSLGADESLKFWKIAEAPEQKPKRDSLSLR